MKEVLIIGAGIAGATSARILAEQGNKIKVIEKRNIVSGHMADEYKDDILIHTYGPHIFHTDKPSIYNFITQFGEWYDFEMRITAFMLDKETYNPFNFHTIDTYYDDKEKALKLKEKLNNKYGDKATIVELLEDKDKDIKEFAEFLFREDYSQYSAKQWGIEPTELDPQVLKRVPVRLNYGNLYRDEQHIGLFKKGYVNLIENMLNHPSIEVQLNTDGLDKISFEDNKVLYENKYYDKIIYTGPIDKLFDYKFGGLPYRSLDIKLERFETKQKLPTPVAVYPEYSIPYTRITEYSQFMLDKDLNHTILSYEHPIWYDRNKEMEPYYPVLTDESRNQYNKYKELAENYENLMCIGRLAEFKYLDMDTSIENVLERLGVEYDGHKTIQIL